jgi:hypothetical protein
MITVLSLSTNVIRCVCEKKCCPTHFCLALAAWSSGIVPNRVEQGCQMVRFQTKNPNMGKFWGVLQWKILVYFMTIWSILRPLEMFYGHLLYFVVIYISPRFGILYQEKSGNPGVEL